VGRKTAYGNQRKVGRKAEGGYDWGAGGKKGGEEYSGKPDGAVTMRSYRWLD